MGLCQADGIRVERIVPLGDAAISRALVKAGLWNLGAERILVRITRA